MHTIIVFLYNRDLRERIANRLRLAGYGVFAEASAAEAWERILTVRPQLVITDYPAYVPQQPDTANNTLVDLIRAHSALQSIPVFNVTSDPSAEWLERAGEAGITYSMAVPFDLEVLVEAVCSRLPAPR